MSSRHELRGDVAGVLDADAEDDGLLAVGEAVVMVKSVSGDGGAVDKGGQIRCHKVTGTAFKLGKIRLSGCIYRYRRERANVNEIRCARPDDQVIEHIPKPLA